MKVRFNEKVYDLLTRDFEDALLKMTIMKDGTIEEIMNDIMTSQGICVMDDMGAEIVTYEGYSDLMVIKDYGKAVSFDVMNNFILQKTMEVAGRVGDLETESSRLQKKTEELESTTNDLNRTTEELNSSQENQDLVIADILDMV